MSETVHLFLSGTFSQWKRRTFVVDDVRYNCAEQYMMAGKARLFGDDEMLAAIMAAKDPREQKKLGGQVRGFDEAKWAKHREAIVFTGNWAKFSQNEDLAEELLATGDITIAEAAPYDPVWGIALSEHDPLAQDPKTWKGLNLLGKTLMRVREKLRAEAK